VKKKIPDGEASFNRGKLEMRDIGEGKERSVPRPEKKNSKITFGMEPLLLGRE